MPGPERVLVVEDAAETRTLVGAALRDAGFEVAEAGDGREALALAGSFGPDLAVVDLGLPDISGLDVLRHLLAHDVPVIILSARSEEDDRVVGLELGADDYLPKPFSPRELTARVRAVLRRSHPAPAADAEILRFDGIQIDLAARTAQVRGEPVTLRAREFDLLAFLASSPHRVFTREQLLRLVWDSHVDWQDPRTVTEHVRRVRLLIEADPASPRHLVTVRGVGYRFDP